MTYENFRTAPLIRPRLSKIGIVGEAETAALALPAMVPPLGAPDQAAAQAAARGCEALQPALAASPPPVSRAWIDLLP